MRIPALAILTIGIVSTGAPAGPDVRSGLSGLPACVRPGGRLLRMPLHVAASVQRVGIGPRGTVRHQSIFRGRARARGLSAASPGLKSSGSEGRPRTHTNRLVSTPFREGEIPRPEGCSTLLRDTAPSWKGTHGLPDSQSRPENGIVPHAYGVRALPCHRRQADPIGTGLPIYEVKHDGTGCW